MAPALAIIGFMGAGKTTAARKLSRELGMQAVDSDALLTDQLGCSVEDYFAREGETAFREREEQLICQLLKSEEPKVVSLGGGAVESPAVRDALRTHRTLYMEVDAETAWERVKGRRPLARDPETFRTRLEQRRPYYEDLADVIYPGRRPGGLSTGLQFVPQSEAQVLWAASDSGHYPVLLGDGATRNTPPSAGRTFLVTDSTVAGCHRESLPKSEHTCVIPPGEESKSLAHLEGVLRELAQAGMRRGDTIVAAGGGVVGDLAGFCAAVYQRGVSVVHMPTTIIAQVDSAFGGKTGVDLPEGKNYIGCYHQPTAVIVDPTLLRTLPERERAAGWAEVIKTGLIAGGHLWEAVLSTASESLPNNALLRSCILVKLGVVERDERDRDVRQYLNLGHTVGHAIEAVTGYQSYSHGEAVGLGLLAALRLSDLPELRERVAELLNAHGLPTKLEEGIKVSHLVEVINRDKKRTSGHVPFVLVNAVGDLRRGCRVETEELRESLRELGAL